MVPCGSCVGCRAARAGDWALRCVHEAQLHDENCFITLTFNDEHLPRDGSVRVDVLQRFFRRARKAIAPKRLRYFACGEYGEENWRPHYHAAVFGHGFRDRFAQVRQRPPLFRSALLEELWCDGRDRSLGHSSVGELTYESAAYVARYVMKKLTGPRAEEYGGRKPPFVVMSLKPGLGAKWFELYQADVFPADEIVHDGRRHRVPRYYDKKLAEVNEAELNRIKAKREESATARPEELSDRRMRVREGVAEARLRAFRRKL